MTIGYVGLGNMGGALARRLSLRRRLNVFDRDRSAVEALVAAGASASTDLGDLAGRSELIFLCLPTSDHVREVLFGDDGLISSMRRGTVIVDQTTGDPNATRAMAADLAGRGIALVDAPVSGGAQGAAAGTISIMVGGGPEELAQVRPVLEDISPNVFVAGGVGAGHTMKLVNNLLSCVQRMLTLEGVALAAKNGIDPAKAVEILLAGGGRNGYLEQAMASRILEGDLEIGFTLGLAHKDVRLACELGSASKVPMFLGNVTRELYLSCLNEMGEGATVDSAALMMDRLAGTHIVPTSE